MRKAVAIVQYMSFMALVYHEEMHHLEHRRACNGTSTSNVLCPHMVTITVLVTECHLSLQYTELPMKRNKYMPITFTVNQSQSIQKCSKGPLPCSVLKCLDTWSSTKKR